MTVSAVQRHHDGTIRALDENGWFTLNNGDAVDMGDGQSIQLDGPSQIGGGSAIACAAVVLAGLATLAATTWVHFGQGAGS